MPIISIFPSGSGGSGGGGGGIPLNAVTNIATVTSSGKVHIKWTDPDDIVVSDITLAKWAGTLLVRKEGSTPMNRRDGELVVDSKSRNAYKNQYYVDEGLTNGKTYYYKFFPYTTQNNYAEDSENEFNATPQAVPTGDVSGVQVTSELNGRIGLVWTDPALTIVKEDVVVSTWASTKVVYRTDDYPTSPEDGTEAKNSTIHNEHQSTPLVVTGLENGTLYYFAVFPISTDGVANTNAVGRITATPNKTKISTIPSQNGTLTYSGGDQNPDWNDFNETELTLSGVVSAINAGTYFATFTPTEDYCWDDGSSEAKDISWTIERATLTVPTQNGTLTYNSTEQTPAWNNFDETKMTLSGVVNGTNAGSYDAEFTPGDNYKWPDDSITTKTVTWKINKATSTITLSKYTITLNTSKKSDTFDITLVGDGAISVKSADANVVKATLNNMSVTVESVNENNGSVDITVSGTETENYSAPTNKVCTVSAEFVSPTLNDNTWAAIKAASDSGKASSIWAVGDAKQLKVNGTVGATAINMDVWAFILGFDHNSAKEGANKIHFQIGRTAQGYTATNGICFVDGGYGSYQTTQGSFTMNPGNSSTSTNSGGWNNSHMRKTVLGSANTPTSPGTNTFLAALPLDLRNVMKSCTKFSDNTGGTTNNANAVTSTVDYLWLLAEFEVFGQRTYASQYEQNSQQQYEYYRLGNSKVRYRHNALTSTANWWLRSVYAGNTTAFCRVRTDGPAHHTSSGRSYGVAPGFCV